MARLTAEQWEQARAEYEVRGVSLGEVARRFGVSDVAVGKRARKEAWAQGKSSDLVEKKVSAIKELCEAERQSSDLPQTIRTTIDDVVREPLEADHMLAQFDRATVPARGGWLCVAVCRAAGVFAHSWGRAQPAMRGG